ncbi:hypothetical protein MO973_44565 [Paenibacillus sp. TRM 82003]|uniref:hypothetical protein n=1 Tax=Kineococcus sp. TRM81007 TaxID=2925831 RepID=UPI001F5AE959|nr:hypothetical protein [Kineococcus sp. TRM81007]MCI2238607.1 hypothetical protein [Kineococcus sp. TRM81007]MCI3927269.1 hypothetical protein [Paenibacillus sp. TRM 82003]
MESLRRRPRAAGGALAVCAALVLVGSGCSGDEVPGPAPTTTTVEPTLSPTPGTAGSTTTSPAFACSAVQSAQEELDGAFAAELERLDVPRGDPRAQSVYALVTTEEGPSYYASVLAVAPPELAEEARLVLDYYERLAQEAGDLAPATGSAADLAAAVAELDRAVAAVDDPAAGTAAVEAQERLQTALTRSCSGEADDATPSGTATPVDGATTTSTAPAATTSVTTGA